jgi:hypothetical protein
MVIAKDNIAFESMNNGEFVSCGEMAIHTMLKLSIVIRKVIKCLQKEYLQSIQVKSLKKIS